MDTRIHTEFLGDDVPLVQVLVTDPSKLQAIRDREEDIMKERIELILKAV